MASILMHGSEQGREASALPILPQGYEGQPARAYSDRTGRFVAELTRVYGLPGEPSGIGLVPTRRLDRGRTFWSVSEHVPSGVSPDSAPPPRRVSYSEAVQAIGARLGFERFCSLQCLVEDLGALLGLPAAPWSDDREPPKEPLPIDLRNPALLGRWFTV